LRADELELLHTLSPPTLHPDGDRAVVAVIRPDVAGNDYVGQLWSVPIAGGAPTRLTRGHRDTAPRHSPDGQLLAFLRAGPDGGTAQLHVVAAAGGEPVALTHAPLGVAAPNWSPDSRRLTYQARCPEAGRYGTDTAIAAGAEPPRLITDLRYLEDGVGYVGDRRTQVFVVEVPDLLHGPVDAPIPASQQVTDGPYEAVAPVWSPAGDRLAFVSARHETRTVDLRVDVWTCAPDGADLVRVTPTSLAVEQVAWSADSAALWLLASDPGPDGREFIARHTGLFSLPAEGSAPPVRHTDADTVDLGEVGAHLTVTAEAVVVQNRSRGAVELLRVAPGTAPEPLLVGPYWVTGHDVVTTVSGPVIVASVLSADSPGELFLAGPDARRLTDFGAQLREQVQVRPLHEVTVHADDGYPVHGWVVLPEGPGPHPVLLDIHGGPFTQYGWQLYDEAQVLAGAGYAVVLGNPRGSAGYGQKHGSCITGALGDRDTGDLLDLLDGVLADPALHLDAERMGVLGGSYGGYMTAWLLAHPRAAGRFRGAVVERGFLDPVSFAGTSDIGWFFGHALVGEDPEQISAQSPMAVVNRVSTPTLVIHSEQDYRCSLEQGQRYFAALLRRGVPAELLVFPGESHGLTRTGQPRHRRQRFEHLLRWWAEHLPVTPVSRQP